MCRAALCAMWILVSWDVGEIDGMRGMVLCWHVQPGSMTNRTGTGHPMRVVYDGEEARSFGLNETGWAILFRSMWLDYGRLEEGKCRPRWPSPPAGSTACTTRHSLEWKG